MAKLIWLKCEEWKYGSLVVINTATDFSQKIWTLLDAFCAKLAFAKQTTTYLVIYTQILQRSVHFVSHRKLVTVKRTYKNIFQF